MTEDFNTSNSPDESISTDSERTNDHNESSMCTFVYHPLVLGFYKC